MPPKRLHGFAPQTLIPSDLVIKQTNFIDIEFTIEGFVANEKMMLLSRDESGQPDSGHFSLYIDADRRLGIRNQGTQEQGQIEIKAQQQFEAGQTHRAQIVIGPSGLRLFLDGVEVANSNTFYPLSGNDLPLVIGASCWAVSRAECVADPSNRRAKPEQGDVYHSLMATRTIFIVTPDKQRFRYMVSRYAGRHVRLDEYFGRILVEHDSGGDDKTELIHCQTTDRMRGFQSAEIVYYEADGMEHIERIKARAPRLGFRTIQ